MQREAFSGSIGHIQFMYKCYLDLWNFWNLVHYSIF